MNIEIMVDKKQEPFMELSEGAVESYGLGDAKVGEIYALQVKEIVEEKKGKKVSLDLIKLNVNK